MSDEHAAICDLCSREMLVEEGTTCLDCGAVMCPACTERHREVGCDD